MKMRIERGIKERGGRGGRKTRLETSEMRFSSRCKWFCENKREIQQGFSVRKTSCSRRIVGEI